MRESIDKLQNRKFDAILHIAGQSSGEISFEDPVYDLQTNCQSTIMLLDYARRNGCKKFVYASTMSVYGDPVPPECSEVTALVPNSFYAVGKLASEHYMRIFSKSFGMTCTVLRLFNTYGPGQNMQNLKQGMVSIYLAMAVDSHSVTVKGSKERFRDFVYIDDVVLAFIKALEREQGYACYNVCTGEATTVEQVLDTIKKKLPYDIDVRYAEGTPGDQFGIFGNNTKIRNELGWNCNCGFDEGIGKMIEWAIAR